MIPLLLFLALAAQPCAFLDASGTYHNSCGRPWVAMETERPVVSAALELTSLDTSAGRELQSDDRIQSADIGVQSTAIDWITGPHQGCGGAYLVDGKCEMTVVFPDDADCRKVGVRNEYTCRWSLPAQASAPLSHCYVPGEAHTSDELPCVEVEP